jgi:hypothetical protein
VTRPSRRPVAPAVSLLVAGVPLLGWALWADRLEWAVPANLLLSAGIVSAPGVGWPKRK